MSYEITPHKHTTNKTTVEDKLWFGIGVVTAMITMVAFWMILIFIYYAHTTGLAF